MGGGRESRFGGYLNHQVAVLLVCVSVELTNSATASLKLWTQELRAGNVDSSS